MKGINKITTLILFIVWLLVIWWTFWVSPPKETSLPVELNSEGISSSKEQSEGLDEAANYAFIINQLKAPFNISRYQELFTRNIFVKPEKPIEVLTPESLKLVAVERVTLPFIYNGYIETPNGTIIGQVNWAEKTYFVKKGEKFKDYKVIEIQQKRLIVEGKEGQLVLEFKKPGKGKEFIIKLCNELDGKIYELRKGDEISGYKILDITSDSVVIWGKNKEWVIKKGR